MNEAETWIVENQRWFYAVARYYRSRPELVEELAQEGMMEALRAARRWKGIGNLPGWMKHAARFRIKQLAFPQANRKTAADLAESSFDTTLSGVYADDFWGSHEDDLDHALASRHLPEVRAAIDSLTDREQEYIRLKFFEGADTATLEARMGVKGCHAYWRRAKVKLQKQLAHLKELAP